MRSIRRADFDDPRAGARHDVRNPERAADLDQLAARHDRLAAAGPPQRAEREQHGAGGIVHHERVRRARQLGQEIAAVRVPRAARAAAEVVFERRVALRDAGERGDRGRRERGAAEVCVQHYAGRVDDGRQ